MKAIPLTRLREAITSDRVFCPFQTPTKYFALLCLKFIRWRTPTPLTWINACILECWRELHKSGSAG